MLKQFFIFGRGKRGSRQRPFVEFKTWGGTMRVHECSIKIAQVGKPSALVVKVGQSRLNGQSRMFADIRPKIAFHCVKNSIRDFRKVRIANKSRKTA